MQSELTSESDTQKEQTTMAWIVVLAIAITCCAILFVVFANYLVSINKNMAAANARLSMMESNETQLLSELQALHRSVMANQSMQNQPKANPPATQPQQLPAATAPPSPAAPPSPSAPPAPPPITH